MTRPRILLGVSSVAILMAAKAEAGTLWVANMNQAQEVPPTGVPYTGTGFLILNDAESSAVVTATHNIPAAIVTGGHIHRGPVGVNGPIILPFPNNGVSPVGPLTWAIPPAEVVNLKADGLYMNIHTQQFPAGAIRGQIVPSLLATSATNAPQLAVANALDVSAGFTPDLDLVLMSAAVASAGTNAQLLNDLSAGTVYVQGRHAVETMASFQETLFSLTEDLAGSSAQGFGVFATAGDSFGKRDAVIGQPRSKISRPWVLAGVDFGSGAGVRGGLGVGYAKGKDKFRGGFGKTDVETTSVQAFVSTGQKVVVSAVAGYGWNKFDTQRNIASLGRTASSSHDGNVWALGAKVSAPLTFNGNLNISPYGQVDMQHARIKAYSETGAGSVGLVVPKRTDESTAIEAGAALSVPMSVEGGDMTARLQAGWRYRVRGDFEDFATSFVGSPVSFQTNVLSPHRSAAHLAASITGHLGPNLTASAGYRGLISKDFDVHTLEVRVALIL